MGDCETYDQKCQLARQGGSCVARRVLTMHGVSTLLLQPRNIPLSELFVSQGIKGGFRHKPSKPQLTASQSEGDSHNFRFLKFVTVLL